MQKKQSIHVLPSKMTAVFDLDRVAYNVAAAGDKWSIRVTHPELPEILSFKTKTEFWGSKRSRDGGVLAEINRGLHSPLKWDEFDIEEMLSVSPIYPLKTTLDKTISRDLAASGAFKAIYFIGGEENYRLNKSTLMEYKGNRDRSKKPTHLEEIKKYLIKKYKATVVNGVETDDAITEAAYDRYDRFVLGNDKDIYAQPTLVFNPDYPEERIVNCDCLGRLWKGKTSGGTNDKYRGVGRKWLYFQMLAGDDADNYKPFRFSDKSFGEAKAIKALSDLETDKQCLEKIVSIYKDMYPEPTEVVGWRGDKFEIDWMYVLNEMFQMARMRRWEGDEIHIKSVLDKLEIKYE